MRRSSCLRAEQRTFHRVWLEPLKGQLLKPCCEATMDDCLLSRDDMQVHGSPRELDKRCSIFTDFILRSEPLVSVGVVAISAGLAPIRPYLTGWLECDLFAVPDICCMSDGQHPLHPQIRRCLRNLSGTWIGRDRSAFWLHRCPKIPQTSSRASIIINTLRSK